MILSARHLSIAAGGRELVRDLSFELAERELGLATGLPGPGATALGLAACGFARFIGPDAVVSGSLELFGNAAGQEHRDAGLALENPYVQMSGMKRTVGGELAFPLECRGVPGEDIPRQVRRMLGMLGIAHLEHRSLHAISGGELKRVAIGACLVTGPRFVFLDRPFAELDPAFRLTLATLLREHARATNGAALVAEDAWLLPPSATFEKTIRAGETQATEPSVCESPALPVPGAEPALVIESVSFAYPGGRNLFDRFSLAAAPGEVVFLEGPNGAGKTTLAKLIAGILAPAGGTVRIAGMPVKRISPLVGFAPQNPLTVLCRPTVREELDLARKWGNDPANLTPLLRLEPLFGKHPLELTRAEQKRLALALAYGPARRVVILDEPSQYQDQEGFRNVTASICAMAREGIAVLVITHDPRFRAAFPGSRVVSLG